MKELICIVCPRGCHLQVDENNGYSVSGNACERGAEYGHKELTAPTRVITSTVKIEGAAYSRCPVKTDIPVPKGVIFEAMKLLDGVTLKAPVAVGDKVLENILGTEASFIVTRKM